jgi:hypothetical protein
MAQVLRWTLIDEWPQEAVKRQDAQEKSRRPITRYRNNNLNKEYLFYKRLHVPLSLKILK